MVNSAGKIRHTHKRTPRERGGGEKGRGGGTLGVSYRDEAAAAVDRQTLIHPYSPVPVESLELSREFEHVQLRIHAHCRKGMGWGCVS